MWFSLCQGEDLKSCASCLRRSDQYTPEQTKTSQWIVPITARGQCADRMVKPSSMKPEAQR